MRAAYFPQIERLRFTQPVLRASEMDPQSCRILRERLIDAASRYFGAVEWYELRCAAGINRMMECLLGAADFYLLGCNMKPEYVDKVDHFFAYTDRNNRKRIYEEIIKYFIRYY